MYNVALLMLNKAFEVSSILHTPYHFRTDYFHSNLCQVQTHTHATAILLISDIFSFPPPHIFNPNILQSVRAAQEWRCRTINSMVRVDKARRLEIQSLNQKGFITQDKYEIIE